jgi:hypothetical protein
MPAGSTSRSRESSVTAAPAIPAASSVATHSSDSWKNRGSTRAHCPRCSTVSASAASAPQHSAAASACTATAERAFRRVAGQRCGHRPGRLGAVPTGVEHRHLRQTQRDHRGAVGQGMGERAGQRVQRVRQRPGGRGGRDDEHTADHRPGSLPRTSHGRRRTAQMAPPPTMTAAIRTNGHIGMPLSVGLAVAVADGPGVPVLATVSWNDHDPDTT